MIDESVRIYSFEDVEGVETEIINGRNYVVIGSKDENYLTVYENTISSNPTIFEHDRSTSEAVIKDEFGNIYNLFGEIIAGPNQGERLGVTDSYIGYWFSFSAFFEEDKISFFSE